MSITIDEGPDIYPGGYTYRIVGTERSFLITARAEGDGVMTKWSDEWGTHGFTPDEARAVAGLLLKAADRVTESS